VIHAHHVHLVFNACDDLCKLVSRLPRFLFAFGLSLILGAGIRNQRHTLFGRYLPKQRLILLLGDFVVGLGKLIGKEMNIKLKEVAKPGKTFINKICNT
jgi:hypothetical protein